MVFSPDVEIGRESLSSDIQNISDVGNIFASTFIQNVSAVRNFSCTRCYSKSPELEDIAEEETEDEGEKEACDVTEKLQLTEGSSENIKVFLRVRPEKMAMNYEICKEENLLKVTTLSQQINKTATVTNFKFDNIFSDNSEQWPVVECCALPLLRDLLIGNNSLLFTYGVTSSGKTFTMRGDRENPGIIPQCLAIFFETLGSSLKSSTPEMKPVQFSNLRKLSNEDQYKEQECRNKIFNDDCLKTNKIAKELGAFKKFAKNLITDQQESVIGPLRAAFRAHAEDPDRMSVGVWISYWEVYNDNVADLLNPGKHSRKSAVSIHSYKNQDNSDIFFLLKLRQVYVTSAEEAYRVFLFGQKNIEKHIKDTALNSCSSRSHSSFNISLVRRDIPTATTISFCDLAGLERTKKSQVNSEGQTEAGIINNSLSVLGQCLSQLRTKKSTLVKYRNSKLTKVLQPFLSGNGGRAYVIYNLNPKQSLFDESYYSLSFCNVAKRVKQQTPAPSKSVRKIASPNLRESIKAQLSYAEEDDTDQMRTLPEEMNIAMLVSSSQDSENQKLMERIGHLEQQLIELEQQKAKWFLQLEEMENQIQSVRDDYNEQLKIATDEYSKMRDAFEKAKQGLSEKEDEVTRLKKTKTKLSSENDQLNGQLKDLKAEMTALKAENEELKMTVKSKDVELTERQNHLAVIQNQCSSQLSQKDCARLELKLMMQYCEISQCSQESGVGLTFDEPATINVSSDSSFESLQCYKVKENDKWARTTAKKGIAKRTRSQKKANISDGEVEYIKSVAGCTQSAINCIEVQWQ